MHFLYQHYRAQNEQIKGGRNVLAVGDWDLNGCVPYFAPAFNLSDYV